MCYRCHQYTDILTYIKFKDKTCEDVTYPWNKERLLKSQDVFAHVLDPSIEYYGLLVVGDLLQYDQMLMDRFPDKIKLKYSSVVKKTYPMNICCHCGAQQGNNYVYRQVNEMINAMTEIDIIK